MPLFGTLDLEAAMASAPKVASLAPETWNLPGAEVIQISYEVDEAASLAVTPAALHPSIPPYATFSVYRFPESPVGPFTMAMVRLIVRAGIRPRGLLMAAFADSDDAVESLRSGWGYRIERADVSYLRRHDRIEGSVDVDGRTALEVRLEDPEPISGGDIELFDNLHLVQSAGEGPLIVQVDPGYEYHSAERGRADLARFDPGPLGIAGIEPVYGIVGVGCRADIRLAGPRFVIDPTKPAVQGTRRLEASS